jgi:hypothetical protein
MGNNLKVKVQGDNVLDKRESTGELAGDGLELGKSETLELREKAFDFSLDTAEVGSGALELSEQGGDLGLDGRDGNTSVAQDSGEGGDLGLNTRQNRLEVGEVKGAAEEALNQRDSALKLGLDSLELRNVETLDKSKDALDLALDSAEGGSSLGANKGEKALDLGLNLGDGGGLSGREVKGRDVKTLDLGQDSGELGLDGRDIRGGGSNGRGSASDGTLALRSLDTVLLTSVEVIAEVSTGVVQTRVQGIESGLRDVELLGDGGAGISVGDCGERKTNQ